MLVFLFCYILSGFDRSYFSVYVDIKQDLYVFDCLMDRYFSPVFYGEFMLFYGGFPHPIQHLQMGATGLCHLPYRAMPNSR